MTNVKKIKGVIGILTGGGDVPGLNPAIRAVTIRAIREGYKVIGLRRGWAGITELIKELACIIGLKKGRSILCSHKLRLISPGKQGS